MAPAGAIRASGYGELTFNGTCRRSFFQDQHRLHDFNAAEEAKLCSRPENYGRKPDCSRARSMRESRRGAVRQHALRPTAQPRL